MTEQYISTIKNACRNRGVTLVVNVDGTLTLDSQLFTTIKECESYLISKPRIDL